MIRRRILHDHLPKQLQQKGTALSRYSDIVRENRDINIGYGGKERIGVLRMTLFSVRGSGGTGT